MGSRQVRARGMECADAARRCRSWEEADARFGSLRCTFGRLVKSEVAIRTPQRGKERRAAELQPKRSATVRVAACGAARERRKFLTTAALRPRRSRQRPVPVPEGRRRRLAGGKSASADAAPGNRAGWLGAPAGHRRKWPEATRGGGNAAGTPPPKTSSMPRWGMARSAAQPGAAPAQRACPRLISCGVPPGRRAKR